MIEKPKVVCPYCGKEVDQLSPTWFKCRDQFCGHYFENEKHKEDWPPAEGRK